MLTDQGSLQVLRLNIGYHDKYLLCMEPLGQLGSSLWRCIIFKDSARYGASVRVPVFNQTIQQCAASLRNSERCSLSTTAILDDVRAMGQYVVFV